MSVPPDDLCRTQPPVVLVGHSSAPWRGCARAPLTEQILGARLITVVKGSDTNHHDGRLAACCPTHDSNDAEGCRVMQRGAAKAVVAGMPLSSSYCWWCRGPVLAGVSHAQSCAARGAARVTFRRVRRLLRHVGHPRTWWRYPKEDPALYAMCVQHHNHEGGLRGTRLGWVGGMIVRAARCCVFTNAGRAG